MLMRRKHSVFLATLSVSMTLMVASAAASPVVMLQFGSFEGKAEADQRLAAMKTKHAGILGDMPGFVREVKTPYGSTVYRTQVGPLAGRPQAQSICAQLASSGDNECYIVETALPQSANAPALKAAQPAPKETKKAIAPEPTVATTPKVMLTPKPAPLTKASVAASKTDEQTDKKADAGQATAPVTPPAMDAKKMLTTPNVASIATLVPETTTPPTPDNPTGRINALYNKVASPEAREPITDTAKGIKQGSTQTVASSATRDPHTAKMLASVGSAQPHPTTAPLKVIAPQASGVNAMAAPDASMEEALAKAAENQPTMLKVKTPKTVEEATRESAWYDTINPFGDEETPAAASKSAASKPVEMEEESFLDSINPFSDSPAEKAKRAVLSSPAPAAKTSASAAQLVVKESPVAPVAPAVQSQQPLPSQRLAAPMVAPAVASPVASSALQTPASKMDLPPPPLPASDAERAALASQIAQQPMNIQAPVSMTTEPPAAPVRSAPLAPLVIPKGTSLSEAARMMDAHNVKVEEARRVPISGAEMEPVPTPPVVATSAPVTVAPADMPSQTATNRTLWAHISYFDTAQDALAFWEKFRKASPDFPSVRVRVTSPYVAQQQGNSLISLRVGPFASHGFIRELCDSNAVDDGDYTCSSITDVGSAASSPQPRMEQAVGTNGGRYGNSGVGMTARSGAWVQLGAYTSQDQAQRDWQAMKLKHPAALRAMQAQLSTPPQGSHAAPVYRLRTGPFLSQTAAEELCLRLKADGSNCLVVSEQ